MRFNRLKRVLSIICLVLFPLFVLGCQDIANQLTTENLEDKSSIFKKMYKSAVKKDAGAQYNLGMMYEYGQGVEQNDIMFEAFKPYFEENKVVDFQDHFYPAELPAGDENRRCPLQQAVPRPAGWWRLHRSRPVRSRFCQRRSHRRRHRPDHRCRGRGIPHPGLMARPARCRPVSFFPT